MGWIYVRQDSISLRLFVRKHLIHMFYRNLFSALLGLVHFGLAFFIDSECKQVLTNTPDFLFPPVFPASTPHKYQFVSC